MNNMLLEINARKEERFKEFLRKKVPPLGHSQEDSLFIRLHGHTLEFRFTDLNLGELIKQHLPSSLVSNEVEHLPTHHVVKWRSTQELGIEWNQSGDHHCKLSSFESLPIVTQRDFACQHASGNETILVSDADLDDGFFNFLRYFIPRLLLAQNKFVFHCSGVTNSDDSATIFLGHSGFGKTTICSKFPSARITGDDMHVVSVKNDTIWVEPTHLGQTITSWEKQGEIYPLKNIYWLNKGNTGPQINTTKVPATEQRLKLLGSLSGLFWENLSPIQVQQVLNFTQSFLRLTQIRNLSFSLESEVSRYVD